MQAELSCLLSLVTLQRVFFTATLHLFMWFFSKRPTSWVPAPPCSCVLEQGGHWTLPGPVASQQRNSPEGIDKVLHYVSLLHQLSPSTSISCHTAHLSATPYLSPPPTAASASYRKQAICFGRGGCCICFLTLAHKHTPKTPDKHTLFQYVNRIQSCSPITSHQMSRRDKRKK